VFQIQMARAVDTVPLTRDYMVEWELNHASSPEPTIRAAE
jgi:hypothetical protein